MGEVSVFKSSQSIRVLGEKLEIVCRKLEKQVAEDEVKVPRIQKSLHQLSEVWNQFDTEYWKEEEGDHKCQDYLRLEERKDEVQNITENVLMNNLGATSVKRRREDEEPINLDKMRRVDETKYTPDVGIGIEQETTLQEFITEKITISARKKEEFDQLFSEREIINYDERTVTKTFDDIQIDMFPSFIEMLKDATNIQESIINKIQNPCNPKKQLKIFSGNSSGLQRNYGVYASMMKPGGLTVDVAYAYFSMDASLTSRNTKAGHPDEEDLVRNFIKYKTMNAFLEAGYIKHITYKEPENSSSDAEPERSSCCGPCVIQ